MIPELTVVIPYYNRADTIQLVLESVARARHDLRIEVIVVACNDFCPYAEPRSVKKANSYQFGAKVVRHSRKIVFQLAEVAVPRELFRAILEGIGRLRLPAAASG